ncbi:Ig-like domain-containing protein [Uruburuella testudinis]|uniref:Ig-like domain-containing protein n=1 Tax=Uruburuella testudinis TaxID=1282863 RepID=A0ABY4DQU3_9NEIS|nr:Ig-like domain-containing protein [Uruburuella testudinis]UOO81422.1 Ig-like domain-containing protein [Uruburuella testudinis]
MRTTLTISDDDNDGKPTAAGTAEPGSTVTVTWPDGSTSTTAADAEGKYSVEADTVQPEGEVSAVATDVNGNEGDKTTETYSDSTAPAAPSISLSDNDNDGKPTAAGTAEPGSTVTVTWPDGSTSTAVADAEGKYSVEADTVQPEGEVSAVATDVNGNEGEKATETYSDESGPAAPTVSLSDDDNDGKPTAVGTAEPGSTVTVTWPDGSTGTAVADTEGKYSVEADAVQPEGEVSAVATDVNGNEGEKATETYSESTAPAVAITGITEDTDGSISVSGTAEPGSTVVLTDTDGKEIGSAVVGSDGSWSIDSEGTVPAGDIKATATDVNGQEGSATETYADETAPAVAITGITEDTDGSISVSGTAEPGSTVVLTDKDGQTIGSAVVGSDGNWSIDSEGTVPAGELTATATDVNGQEGSATKTYADETAPAVAIDDVAEKPDGSISVSGTAEPGSTVVLTDKDGQTIGSAVVGSDGNWSIDSEGTVPAGDIKATATDVNGQEGSATETYADETAPAVAITGITEKDDGSISVSGTAEAGSTVVLTDKDGTEIGSAVVGSDGNWSIDSEGTVAAGELTATATDANGQEGSATETYADETAPAVAITGITEDTDGSISVSGTAEPGSTVVLTDTDGQTIGSAVVGSDGNWSIDSEGTVAAGDIKATATDVNGQEGTATETYNDSTAPAVAIDDVAEKPDGSISVSGTAEPGSTVVLTDKDGTEIGSAVVGSDGNWSIDSEGTVAAGDIKATATDVNGQEGSATETYTDSTAPAVAITGITEKDDGSISVSGTAEPGSTVVLTDKDGTEIGSAVVGSDGNWSIDSEGTVAAGELTATATDVNGQEGSATETYADETAPAVAITGITEKDDGSISVSGTAEPGSTVVLTDTDGQTIGSVVVGEDGNWSIGSEGTVAAGDIKATATDVNGQEGSATETYADETAPAVAITGITEKDDGSISVSGTAEPGSTVVLTDKDGKAIGSAVVGSDGNWSIDSEGTVPAGDIKATATDVNGQEGSATETYADETAPAVAITGITEKDDGSISVSGTAEPGSTVVLTDTDGQTIGSVVVGSDGNWSIDSEGTVAAGELTATATDVNGQEGSATETYTDETAPAVAITGITEDTDGSISVSGTAEPGSTVVLTDTDGQTIGSVVVGEDGSWSIDSEGTVPAGDIKATATDVNGQTADDSILYVDTVPPKPGELVLTEYEDSGVDGDAISTDNTFVLGVTGNETGSQVTYQIKQGDVWVDLSSGVRDAVPDGVYEYRAKVADASDNVAYTEVKKVIVDTTTPEPMVYMDVSSNDYLGDLFIEPGRISDDARETVAAGTTMHDGSSMTIDYTLTGSTTQSTLVVTKTNGSWAVTSGVLATGMALNATTGKIAIERGTLVEGSVVKTTEYNINGKTAEEINRAPIVRDGILSDTWNETTYSVELNRPPLTTPDNDFIFLTKNIRGGRLETGAGADFVAIGSPASYDGGVQYNARVNMGEGDDTLIVYDRLRTNSIVDMGEGNNRVELGNIHNNAQLRFGSGDDILSFIATRNDNTRNQFDYDTDTNVKVSLGDGNNLMKTTDGYGVEFLVGTINSGSGDDVFDLQNSSFQKQWVHLNSGAGDDTVHLGGMTDGSINMGAGSDQYIISADTTYNHSFAGQWGRFSGGTVSLGTDDDTFTIGNGANMSGGTVNLDAGNDIVKLVQGGNLSGGTVNGGAGYDAFIFEGVNQTLNLNRLKTFEKVDLTGNGNNRVTIAASDVLANFSAVTADGAAAAVNALIVKGDAGDTADLWTTTSSGTVTYQDTAYHVYTTTPSGTSYQVWVQDTVNVI